MLTQETSAIKKLLNAIEALRDAVSEANDTECLNIEVDVSMSLNVEVED